MSLVLPKADSGMETMPQESAGIIEFTGTMYALPPMISSTNADPPGTFRLDPALRCDTPAKCATCFDLCGLPTGSFPMTDARVETNLSWVPLRDAGVDAVVVDVEDARNVLVRLWMDGVEYTQAFETDFGDHETSLYYH